MQARVELSKAELSERVRSGSRVVPLRRWMKRHAVVSNVILVVIGALALFPIYFMVDNALKTGTETGVSPFSLPVHPQWKNFSYGWTATKGSYLFTGEIVVISVVGIAITTLLGAYVFARLRFREKELLFYLVFGLMLVPSFIVLIPLFVEIHNFDLMGSRWALILPYIAGGQALGIVVLRTFVRNIPEPLFEAAKLDGAGDIWLFRYLVVPLSIPIVISLAVLNVVAFWGDYVLPDLVLNGRNVTVAVAITSFTAPASSPAPNSFNIQLAAFAIASVPVALVIAGLMKYFVRGLSQTAVQI